MQGADDGDARDGDRPQTPPGVGPDTRTTDTPDAASRPDTPDMRGASSTADDDAAGDVLVTVRVPASSANLGPGYDVLGVALDLSLVVEARPFDGRRVAAAGEGEGELPADDDNLVWRAVRAFCDVFGHDVPDVTLHCDNHIPLQRGLGSSSAAAVAGLVVARALCSAPVADQDLIDLATQLEGHADNAAAAVLGGLVVAGPVGPARRFEPARSLRPVVCIPQTRLATSAARALVPTQVPLPTAIASIRRSTLVVAGLSGAASWDPSAMTDDLHEPPRLAAMPASRALIEAARADGHGACLSGAGPSVLVVTSAEDDAVGRIRELAGHAWTVVGSAWNRTGALVEWTRRP
jgi:homoserine kinase